MNSKGNLMKAQIFVNRHKVRKNKKDNQDEPCIGVRTYRGSEYFREIELNGQFRLIQDFENPMCSGATIWIEGPRENINVIRQ